MKKFLLMTMFAALAFVGCKDDTENNNPNNTTSLEQKLVGRWQATTDEGYEIYEGERDEWNDDISMYGMYIEFRADHTVISNDEDGIYQADWMLDGSKLYYGFEQDGYFYIGTISELTDSKLVLEILEKEPDYEYFEKLTFRRTN